MIFNNKRRDNRCSVWEIHSSPKMCRTPQGQEKRVFITKRGWKFYWTVEIYCCCRWNKTLCIINKTFISITVKNVPQYSTIKTQPKLQKHTHGDIAHIFNFMILSILFFIEKISGNISLDLSVTHFIQHNHTLGLL